MKYNISQSRLTEHLEESFFDLLDLVQFGQARELLTGVLREEFSRVTIPLMPVRSCLSQMKYGLTWDPRWRKHCSSNLGEGKQTSLNQSTPCIESG